MYYLKPYPDPFRLVIWEDDPINGDRVCIYRIVVGDDNSFLPSVNKEIFFSITSGRTITTCETLEEAEQMACLEAL